MQGRAELTQMVGWAELTCKEVRLSTGVCAKREKKPEELAGARERAAAHISTSLSLRNLLRQAGRRVVTS